MIPPIKIIGGFLMRNRRIIIPEKDHLVLLNESLLSLEHGKVRIKVLATGVAFADIMMRKGNYPGAPAFPFTPGHEVVGIIESVGTGVHSFKKGQLVAAFCKYGGYTQIIDLSPELLVPIPHRVNVYEAAALLLNYVTAYQLIFRFAQLKDGDSVVVHGASGGVGKAILQLCRDFNLKLYGTASIKNKSQIENLGARFIDYKMEDFVEIIGKNEADVVFDAVGGYHWKRSYQVLKPDGLFIGYGLTFASTQKKIDSAEQQFTFSEWKDILTTGRTSTGHRGKIYSISSMNQTYINEDLRKLFELLLLKRIDPQIAFKLPMSQATEAHQLFEKGANGKILLLCQE
jgi:NADPH:quinone reductase-like Zn-dependent oxidoreductase